MAKRKSYKISIPKVCHQKLGKFDVARNGRYCDTCSTFVVDFSAFTDKELIDFLKKTPHGCGIFAAHQLDRPLVLPVENSNSFLQKALLGTALLAGIAGNASSQVNAPAINKTEIAPSTDCNGKNINNGGADTTTVLRGFVHNSKTKQPLGYIYLSIIVNENYQTSAITDGSGNFTAHVPPGSQGKELKIIVDSYLYHKYTYNDRVDFLSKVPILLKRNHKINRRSRGKF